MTRLKAIQRQLNVLDLPPAAMFEALTHAVEETQQTIHAEHPLVSQERASPKGMARREAKVVQ
eukprot:2067529-Karenia_brevis.AAC.1